MTEWKLMLQRMGWLTTAAVELFITPGPIDFREVVQQPPVKRSPHERR